MTVVVGGAAGKELSVLAKDLACYTSPGAVCDLKLSEIPVTMATMSILNNIEQDLQGGADAMGPHKPRAIWHPRCRTCSSHVETPQQPTLQVNQDYTH